MIVKVRMLDWGVVVLCVGMGVVVENRRAVS
jgi:hypothetical protein